MFPPGLPGIGLLLLRISVAVALLADAYCHHEELPLSVKCAAVLLSGTVMAGVLTPIVAVLGLLVHGFIWHRVGLGTAPAALAVCLDLTALFLLGPGGYSVDAVRFGRQLVVLPPR